MTYKEAINTTDAANWQFTMESEMRSMRENETWDFVKLPKNRPALPCRWVFRLKQTAASSSHKYKAPIIAKGFRQEYGVDIDEVFSPVVKMKTPRFLLGLVTLEDLELL